MMHKFFRDIIFSTPRINKFFVDCCKILGLYSTIDQITDYLFISGVSPVTEENLNKFGISCIVDATNVKNNHQLKNIEITTVCVDDLDTALLKPYFDLISDKIKENKEENRKTLVHCTAGVSRSATLCIVYLVKHENLSLREAYIKVNQKRSIIAPNIGFWRQMIEYEQEIRGYSTVAIVVKNSSEDLIFV